MSRQTVSRAVNDKPEIGPATRQRVLEVADERGWQVAIYSTGSALERETAVAATVVDHVDTCVALLLDPTAIELIQRSGMPFVLVDKELLGRCRRGGHRGRHRGQI
ncbi:hypothetical protein ACFV2X_44125 [Streptomyces sp. NPDC059679]|uniref:hypothetical protein n=1 Tax=Streptomyces sp. NPDC059679 TaxID=3346903 RepID=UPI0036D14D15